MQIGVEVFLGILQQERGATYSAGPADANEAIAPIDVVHQGTANGRFGVVHPKSVCLKKRFHLEVFRMKCVFCGISFSAPWRGLEQVVSAAEAAFERKYTKKDKNVYSEIAKKVKAWSAKKISNFGVRQTAR